MAVELVIRIGLVMIGGGLGALCRYGFTLAGARWLGVRFPWGTLMANMTGCLLIGVAFALTERSELLPPSGRLFFMTGFLGALTTFSTYALESVNYLRVGSYAALANILVNNLGGGALVAIGYALVHLILEGGR
jgi:CrcB protein